MDDFSDILVADDAAFANATQERSMALHSVLNAPFQIQVDFNQTWILLYHAECNVYQLDV